MDADNDDVEIKTEGMDMFVVVNGVMRGAPVRASYSRPGLPSIDAVGHDAGEFRASKSAALQDSSASSGGDRRMRIAVTFSSR
jgi:hypothetical protein